MAPPKKPRTYVYIDDAQGDYQLTDEITEDDLETFIKEQLEGQHIGDALEAVRNGEIRVYELGPAVPFATEEGGVIVTVNP